MKYTSKKEKPPDHKSDKQKEHMFDLLIHDLTVPLSVLSASTANLLHKPDRYGPLTDQQKRIVERILRNARKAQMLLNEMIEVFHSEEGLFEKKAFWVETSLRESMMDALEMTAPQVVEKLSDVKDPEEFRRILEPHGIVVAITGKYCKSPFCHDQRKVQQIFRNLISNAMKYRRERVTLTVSGDTDLIVLVEDDGRGIPPEKQESIFERFVRLRDEDHPAVPGLGLGLTGVRALVEAMGGEITLTSREGMGTRFAVRIPPLS